MKHNRIYVIIILLISLITSSLCWKLTFIPDSHESFLFGSDAYIEDSWPDTSFTGTYNVGTKEAGYPYYSGIVKGINDTIEVYVRLINQTGEHIDITGSVVENWVIPAIFDAYADLRSAPYIDTSKFEHSFMFWRTFTGPTSTPDTIYDEGSLRYPTYDLVYHLWDLPLGWSRLRFFETSMAHPNFEMLLAGMNVIWYTEPALQADTICAFAKIGKRALNYNNYTAAISWADSILQRVPDSVVGWDLRAHAYNKLGNKTLALQAADSVITIGEEYRDGILPDSAGMDDYQHRFLYELIRSNKMIK